MLQPICITNLYNGSVSLKINRFKDGFTQLIWTDESPSGKTLYSNLSSSTITIDNLNESLYTFYTRNPQTGEESNTMSVFISHFTPQERVEKLWKQAEIESSDYNDSLKEKLVANLEKFPYLSLLYLLYYVYESISEIQDFETELFYHLIIVQEKYENMQLGNLNRDGVCFAKLRLQAQPVIDMNIDVDTVKVYSVKGNKDELIQVHKVNSDSIQLTLPEHGFYKIQLLYRTDLLSVLRHCQLSTEYIAQVWEENQSLLESYLNNVEDEYGIGVNDFNNVELIHYLEESSFSPNNPVFPRIEVEESEDRRAVSLKVSGVRFAEASERKFFVSGKDADYLQDTVQNEFFRIYGKTDVFNTDFEPISNMIDKEAILYIVDDRNKIVSRTTRCYFDSDWTTDSSEYHEKIREYELKNFSRKLLSQISSSYEKAYVFMQEVMTRCMEDTDVTIDNVLETVLNEIDSAPYGIDTDKLSFEVLKYWFSLREYNSEFFSSGGFTWSPYTRMLVTEESEDGYVLCVIAKEQGAESYDRHYLHSKSDQAIKLSLNTYGKYIVYAVSEKDYKMSGFLFVNTTTGYTKSYLVNLGVR